MQVSVESTSSIERRMTIGVPAEQVETEIEKRLQQTARTARLNGFRPGKVPMKVVRRKFGPGVRQEVLGEVMRNAYVEALQKEEINPAGYPQFEPKELTEGKDLEFVATFEVYPSIELADLEGVELEKLEAEVAESDVDDMIENLQTQQATWKPVKRKARKKDMLTIDYTGTIDGEAFEGGSAENQKLVLGSERMIKGFESKLVGVKTGEDVVLDLKFPKDYHNEELAGKPVQFAVKVHEVEQMDLPEIDEAFLEKFGVEGGDKEKFMADVKNNMDRELQQALSNKLKQQVVDVLLEKNEFEVPQSLVDGEIDRLRQEAVQQFGGMGQFKPDQLPAELFQDQAVKRVKTGLVFAEMVKVNEIAVDDAQVDAKIQEIAATYQEPEEVVNFYKTNHEQRNQIEAAVMEDLVVSLVVEKAKVSTNKVSYEEAVKPPAHAAG